MRFRFESELSVLFICPDIDVGLISRPSTAAALAPPRRTGPHRNTHALALVGCCGIGVGGEAGRIVPRCRPELLYRGLGGSGASPRPAGSSVTEKLNFFCGQGEKL